MISRSTILHLRFPFSLFLAPFFVFAAAQSEIRSYGDIILTFIILHFLFYPSSNGYNSYFDKDEKSIGGLENPPPVSKELYWVSIVMDIVSLGLALFVNLTFAAMLFILQWVSRAYSHPAVRLKKYAVGGLITVSVFQGLWIYLMSRIGIENLELKQVLNFKEIFSAGMCSLILLGSYPITQVYQHEEDSQRGDRTMSLLLGIRGTFLWVMAVFGLATGLFVWYFMNEYSMKIAWIFLAVLSPTLIYFSLWFLKVWNDSSKADFKSTMRMNLISSMGFIIFFLILWIF